MTCSVIKDVICESEGKKTTGESIDSLKSNLRYRVTLSIFICDKEGTY